MDLFRRFPVGWHPRGGGGRGGDGGTGGLPAQLLGFRSLAGVDDEQSGSLEMSRVACSSEIKEDGLRSVERQHGNHNPFKVAGFKSKEQLRSSEMKEDGLRFVLRGSEDLYFNIIEY